MAKKWLFPPDCFLPSGGAASPASSSACHSEQQLLELPHTGTIEARAAYFALASHFHFHNKQKSDLSRGKSSQKPATEV